MNVKFELFILVIVDVEEILIKENEVLLINFLLILELIW